MLDLTEYLDRKPAKPLRWSTPAGRNGRAIVRQPQAFLMDEPLSNLGCQTAGSDAHTDRRVAEASLGHHRIRHPRPGGGHDHGGPRRGAQGRVADAVRDPA